MVVPATLLFIECVWATPAKNCFGCWSLVLLFRLNDNRVVSSVTVLVMTSETVLGWGRQNALIVTSYLQRHGKLQTPFIICTVQVLEVNYISNLPCIESLNLKDNPITSIMDYRTKVLDLFQDQYVEMTLDGIKTSQKEIDKVAILKAIQKAKDGKTKKLGMRKDSPMRKVCSFTAP